MTDQPAITDGGPCEWPADYIECGTCTALDNLNDDERTRVEQMAVEALWRWTNRVFGLCQVTVRPCRQDCTQGMATFWGSAGGTGGVPWRPILIAGSWFNIRCQRCGDLCGCTDTPALSLPGPVDSISQILIDGQPLTPDAYRVDNRRWLVRTDGGQWPVCQDLSATPTEEGTWQVSYRRGLPVPVGGQIAAGVLACELAKALCNDQSCQLPRRVQTVTRQGVTVAMLDSFNDVDQGRTGIWVIDSWVASITKTSRRSTVRSPDLPKSRTRVQTWPRPRTSGNRMSITITRRPATANLALYAGDDFVLTITVRNPDGTPADLSAAVARAYIRQRAQDIDVAGEFYATVDGNVITLQLPGAVSAQLPARAVWDCEMVTGGRTTTLVAGTIRMTAEVTR